jgi:glycosyltransferase involved in cell wall biosynthesis
VNHKQEEAAAAGYNLAVSDPATAHPTICLNMIVKNEAHIVCETLDSVAPYISSWVIVDTGSDDGTQDLIRNHMAHLGIPGELHERPWRNFGHNRTEALALAQGHADYIWWCDADDTVTGTLDFSRLSADIYSMRRKLGADIYWLPHVYRDGLDLHYEGVTHECIAWDDPTYVWAQLEGEYQIEDRHLSSRNQSGEKFTQDRELLLAEVTRDPEDSRSVFYLAQSCFDLGRTRGRISDFVDAREWYLRRVELGGWGEEVYYSLLRIAEALSYLGASWPEVQDAYLKAWESRPTRAEALYAIASRYRSEQRYQLGYLFAVRAAQIPFPDDQLFVRGDIHSWRSIDEQAVCAGWIGKQAEAFTLDRRLMAQPDVPDDDRQRIARNRDYSVPTMIDAASSYPPEVVQRLAAGSPDAEVTVSLVAGPDRDATEHTLNSFLHCCTDVTRVGRFVVVDAGLSAEDRATLLERYPFLELGERGRKSGPGARLAQIRHQIGGRFWLHLSENWRFFAPDDFITRLTAVLEREPEVFQVGINLADATKLTGATATEDAVRRAPDAGRYVVGDLVASGPAMFETTRLDRAGGIDETARDPIAKLGRLAATAGLRTASLDEVLCIAEI